MYSSSEAPSAGQAGSADKQTGSVEKDKPEEGKYKEK